MNPTHTSPEPGLAPCGMKMEPVYADEQGQTAAAALAPGAVKITPEKQQIIGVRVATVTKSPWTYTLRTVGQVAVDETRLYRIKALTEGWIVKTYPNSTTGSLVRKDEPLATYYIRDLPTTIQSFYYAIDAVDRLKNDPTLAPGQQGLLEAQRLSAEGILLNLGMNQLQIKDLIHTRQLVQEIIIGAPATGFVLSQNVSEGQKFNNGEELFRLADLSRVYILADLFKDEVKYFHPGEKAKVTLAGQDKTYTATMAEVLPKFDPTSLTLKVRLEMDNPGFTLIPGMFVDLEFPIKMPPSVNIPLDAILDSGRQQTVFVAREQGFFEPRRVKTGWRLGDRVEILKGLKPGERIVVSGNFLIDSESRMKLAAAGMFGEVVKDPVCGLKVDTGKAKAAGFQSTYQNQAYYFCSAECKGHFDKKPARYTAKPDEGEKIAGSKAGAPEPEAQAGKAIDPVCGHEVDQAQARAAGLTSTYQGKTYYFCSYSCNHQFDKDPESYLHQGAPSGSGGAQMPGVAKTAKDPVCGLPVDTGAAKQAGRTSEYQGKLYYFDTAGCKVRFDKFPEHYLSKGSETAKAPLVPIQPQARYLLNPEMMLRKQRRLLHTQTKPPSAVLPGQRSMPSQMPPGGPMPPTGPVPSAGPMPPTGPVPPPAAPQPPLSPTGPSSLSPHPPTPPAPPMPPQAQVPPPSPTPPGGEGPHHD